MRIAAFLSLLFLPMPAPAATVRRFARAAPGAAWVPVEKAVPALLRERGLAWGLGLHAVPRDGAPRKREGDRRSPAGVFRLTAAFGAREKIAGLKLPATPVGPTLEAVDDPASRRIHATSPVRDRAFSSISGAANAPAPPAAPCSASAT